MSMWQGLGLFLAFLGGLVSGDVFHWLREGLCR